MSIPYRDEVNFLSERHRQAIIDRLPCPKCGGDRLRADFTDTDRCHVPREPMTDDDYDNTPPYRPNWRDRRDMAARRAREAKTETAGGEVSEISTEAQRIGEMLARQALPADEPPTRAADHYRALYRHWQDAWTEMHATALRIAGERDRAIDRLDAVEKVVRELEANMQGDVGKAAALALRTAVQDMP